MPELSVRAWLRGAWRCAGLCLLALQVAGAAQPDQFAVPVSPRDDMPPGSRHEGVRLLGALRLPSTEINGLPLVELSALAYSADADVLYALSDRGALFSFRPIITDGALADVHPITAVPLRNSGGKKLRGSWADSEGMDIIDARNGEPADDRLLISFERHPRIIAFKPNGRPTRTMKLPPALADIRHYAGRNKALEALTVHPDLGVISSPERPLKGTDQQSIGLYDRRGLIARAPRVARPPGSIVALESLPGGSILVLQRAFDRGFGELIVELSRTARLGTRTAGVSQESPIATYPIATFDLLDDWRLDNFEGLARYRGQTFFMVSDDNDVFWQQTYLWYFEILDERQVPSIKRPE